MPTEPALGSYLEYLQTPDWRRTRDRSLRRAHFRCEGCGAKRGLEVHHRTYERIGHEWDDDLEVLCRSCHQGHHLQEIAASPLGIYLSLAWAVLHESPFSSIADLSERVKCACAAAKLRPADHQIHRVLQLLIDELAVPQNTVPVATREGGRPEISKREARTVLLRLGIEAAIRTMPSAGPSPIDIYAPIHEDVVDHDVY